MARTAVTVTSINRSTGVAPAVYASSDASNGNTVPNDGLTWIELSNTDAGAQTVTVTPVREVDGQAVTPISHSIAAAAFLRLGPFPTSDYSGSLQVDCSVAALKIAAYRLS